LTYLQRLFKRGVKAIELFESVAVALLGEANGHQVKQLLHGIVLGSGLQP
jgi:hypothetical protein